LKDVTDRFNYDLFKFTIDEYKQDVVSMFNDCGISPYVNYTCDKCSHEAITSYDFINFFVFGILPTDMTK
jgi:hypothetical protein